MKRDGRYSNFLEILGGLTQLQINCLSHLSNRGLCFLVIIEELEGVGRFAQGSDVEGLLCWVSGCGMCTADLVTPEECSLVWLQSRLTGESLMIVGTML